MSCWAAVLGLELGLGRKRKKEREEKKRDVWFASVSK